MIALVLRTIASNGVERDLVVAGQVRPRRGSGRADRAAGLDLHVAGAARRRDSARSAPPGRQAPAEVREQFAREAGDDRAPRLTGSAQVGNRALRRVVIEDVLGGQQALRAEVGELERVLAHLEAGRSLSEYEDELPPELEPLTTKPLVEIRNGASGVDVKLEAELAELPEEEAAEFRDGPSALEDVARRVFEAAGLLTFFTAGDTETRAWTLQRGRSALDAAASIHSDIAQGFIRAEVIRWNDLVEAGSHAEAARRGLQRLEGKTYVVEDGDVLNVRFNV